LKGACCAPRSSIHEVDAVLVGGRATPTTNSCTGNRDKAPRRKCSQFLDLIGSVAVAVPADYTRYMNQVCIYMRKVGEAVKDGWQPIAARPRTSGWPRSIFVFAARGGSMRWWMRPAVFTIASWRMTQPITGATIFSAAKPQRRAVALRFLRPGRTREARGHHAWLTPPRPAPHQS
jgi:hypothetical protein